MASYPGKEWRVNPIWPEELADAIEQAGLSRTELTHWEMEAPL